MTMTDDIVTGYITAALWADCMASCETCMGGKWETSRLSGTLSFVHADGRRELYYECETCADAESGGLEHLTVSDDDRAYITQLVRAFLLCVDDAQIAEYEVTRSYDPSQGSVWSHFGHDLRLSSGGHGTGFWDRGLGELGDFLHTLASNHPFSREGYGDVWQVDEDTATFDHWPLTVEVS